jgi:hypothetical protein
LKEFRIQTFFALDDEYENKGGSIFNYIANFKDDYNFHVLMILKLLGDLIKRFDHVQRYVNNYSQVKIKL